MIKTYISALLVVLLSGAQMVQSQESMDDVLAQLETANAAGGQPVATTTVAPAATADVDKTAPAVVESAGAADTDMLGLLFNQGVGYYKAGKYDEAIAVFDAMLALDEYNSQAISYRKRASSRISTKEIQKQEASRAQAFADVEAAWNQPPKVLVKVEAVEGASAADPEHAAIEQMEARLKAINIPTLEFQGAAIEDVVLFLAETSRQNNRTGQDVDFLLVGMKYAMGDSSITVSARDMNLHEALRFIVEMASLKFEVSPNVVSIMPMNYVPLSEMIMKTYDIIPEVGTDLESAGGDSGGGADDLFGDSSSGDAGTGPVDVAAFFSVDVDFPEGSTATYQPRFLKLFVKNTPENLKGVDSILADLDEKAILLRSQQVEIEAKFVEFNEGSLEELGFDWNVFGSGNVIDKGLDPRGVADGAGANATSIDPITGQTIYTDNNNRPGQNVFGSFQRSNSGAFQIIESGLLASMGGTPASMLLGNGDIDLQITAMEQEGTADILSSPKVTTKSGEEAVIRVAETHRYPQDYDVETGQRTSPVVKPQDWEDFDLGVTLKVTPVVNPESNTIDLDLHPEIMKFVDMDLYTVGYNRFDSSGSQTPQESGDGSALIAQMPYFERRSVQTQVTIDDGHTIVMGGMVDERTETFRDQVPFIGDIPYLGRLFRTEGSRTSKRNLTVFVKATMVDEYGMTSAERELARQVAAD